MLRLAERQSTHACVSGGFTILSTFNWLMLLTSLLFIDEFLPNIFNRKIPVRFPREYADFATDRGCRITCFVFTSRQKYTLCGQISMFGDDAARTNQNTRDNHLKLTTPYMPTVLYIWCTDLGPRPRCVYGQQNSHFSLLRKLIRCK